MFKRSRLFLVHSIREICWALRDLLVALVRFLFFWSFRYFFRLCFFIHNCYKKTLSYVYRS